MDTVWYVLVLGNGEDDGRPGELPKKIGEMVHIVKWPQERKRSHAESRHCRAHAHLGWLLLQTFEEHDGLKEC
jgi:hypothetical protein